jgi:hypothetical protein
MCSAVSSSKLSLVLSVFFLTVFLILLQIYAAFLVLSSWYFSLIDFQGQKYVYSSFFLAHLLKPHNQVEIFTYIYRYVHIIHVYVCIYTCISIDIY